jgi:hypothetical protein
MIYTIYAQKDATIYEKTETQNTGLDQLLELSHEYQGASGSGDIYNSRILMKFDVSDIESRVNSGKISQNAKYYLSLRTVDAKEIPQEYTIYSYPISSSWINGTGKFYNKPITTDGVSWTYRTSKNVGVMWDVPPGVSSFEWDNLSQTWIQNDNTWGGSNIIADVTSSYFTNEGGGTWWDYDNLECTQSFNHQTSDVYMDVTNIVKKWITGSGRFENDGLILKFSNEIESLNEGLTSLRFFGTDSNTIYVPKLHVVWDDSSFQTGSLSVISENNLNINVKLKKFYSESEKAKIRIYANELYPQKNYTTQSYYTKNYYLPSSSYYEIRDAHTDEIILPFNSVGTKISCDEKGNYFNLWMNSFQPERFYRVVLKIETNSGDTIQIFDNNYYFKVTR